MIGRQGMHLDAEALRSNLSAFGYHADQAEALRILREDGGYAEAFFKLLGAAEVRSFDASSYEHATDVHDFNLPVDESLKNRFDLVIDGGSLEHVFNFPVALRNCMEMVKVGGHFIAITPTNNFSGHGFYQFSPELFFRVFTADNGFETLRVMLFEDAPHTNWFEVADSDTIRTRVYFINGSPTYLAVIARRVASVCILTKAPQQSHYATMWSGAKAGAAEGHVDPGSSPRTGRMKRLAFALVKMLYRRMRRMRDENTYNPRFFKSTHIP
jgi:SAM-dependent methyltransferase